MATLLLAFPFILSPQEPAPPPVQEPEPEGVASESVAPPQQEPSAQDDGGFASALARLSGQQPWWEDGEEQLSRLDFGLLFDFYSAFSEKDDSDDAYNEVRVRSAMLHARAPVDETASVYATMDFADPGDGAEFVLREAAARIHSLPLPFWPANFHLLVGQYYADLGAWNTVMAHEFPAPQLDGVRRTFLGGNLAARGVEAHHFIPLRNWNLRWSLGLASEVEGQDVDANDFGLVVDDDPAAFDRFGFHNWTWTGRVESQWDLGGERTLRAGVSGLVVPNEVRFTTVPGLGVARDEATHWMLGFDTGFRWELSEGERAHEVSLEVWLDDNEYRIGTPGTLVGEQERGEWLMYEFTLDRNWSFGGLASRFDQPSVGADLDGHYHALWSSYRFSNVNEFSLFFTHTNPAPGEQKWYSIGGEWVLSVGATRDVGHRRWN